MTSASNLVDGTTSELARRVAEGDARPLAIASAALDRISALDGDIRAWVHVDRDVVLDQAAMLDREARAGTLRGPLHGVPIGVKDIYDVVGIPTRAGSRVLADAPPAARDADAVARLRAAGALIVGKTATTEFASADAADTCNPWQRDHTPGGSSSGSAAAVACGMVPAALGTQTAGSVLRPASFCGIVGFKPSFGRIGRRGVLPFAWSLDTLGTLTRSVADAALLLQVLTAEDWPSPATEADEDLTRPQIGYVPRLFPERLHPEMQVMLSTAAARLQAAGARVREARLPADFETALAAHQLTMLAEGAAFHSRTFGDRLALYGPKIRAQVETGLTIPAVAYLEAQRVRADLRERLLPLLQRFDALLVPAAAGPAPSGLAFTGDPSFNAPWTMFGLPAITLPGNRDAGGLPLGYQLVGRPYDDEGLLRVAAWCESVTGPAAIAPMA